MLRSRTPRDVDAGVTDDELTSLEHEYAKPWNREEGDSSVVLRLIAALRSERDGRADDARAIVALADAAKAAGSIRVTARLDGAIADHAKVIEGARERVKK